MQAPKTIPKIRKKLNEVPTCPLYLSSTSLEPIPKHNVVAIPLVEAISQTFKINKTLVKFGSQFND